MLPTPPISTLFPYTTLFRSLGVRVLAARVQRRSANYRQDSAHQPMGYTAYGDRGDAAGSALSAFAGGGQGAELRRQCDGRFLDTRGAGPAVSQGPISESGGATTGWNDRTAGTAGTRSEERRVGKECRSRGAETYEKKKKREREEEE